MVGCGCGVGEEHVITMAALSRRINWVEGVVWCGAGSEIITLEQSMFAVAE